MYIMNTLKKKTHLIDLWPMPQSPLNIESSVVDGEIVSRESPSRTKVAIYGAGYGRDEAPLDDPAWEVFALNVVPPFDREHRLRADRWFDIHQRCAQSVDDLRWIAACPVPIYVPPDLLDASPNAVLYPLNAIEAQFGGYFSCTFAYQIALVLYEGIATDIGLYGVELAYGTERERTVEWACVSYWIGRAEERGLRIHLPLRSKLGRHEYRYGFEYWNEIRDVNEYTTSMRYARRLHDVAGTLADEPRG